MSPQYMIKKQNPVRKQQLFPPGFVLLQPFRANEHEKVQLHISLLNCGGILFSWHPGSRRHRCRSLTYQIRWR